MYQIANYTPSEQRGKIEEALNELGFTLVNETFQSNLDGSLHSCAAQYRYRDVNVPVVINVGDTESVAGIIASIAAPGDNSRPTTLVHPMQRLFFDIDLLRSLAIEAINLVTRAGNSPRGQQFKMN